MPTWASFGVYKIDINQGNYLSQDMVDKLQGRHDAAAGARDPRHAAGRVAVPQGLAGTTSTSSPKQGNVREHRNFTVWFADGKVTRWEGDKMPQSVVELNRSAAAKALPPKGSPDAGLVGRFLDIFRKK